MRILVAEDDSVTRRLLEAHLRRWGHDVVACEDGEQAWAILQAEDGPGLVVLDWIMPGMDGVTLCREIRNLKERPYVYVILLTARTRKEHIIEGLEAGADDYIAKPFDVHELQVRVRAGSRIVRLQEDLMSALAASDYQATHDALTGLWNRRAILDILGREMARSGRQGIPVGVLIADLDHFKQVNDAHGHLAGDAVLSEAALRLTTALRPYDTIGRYGGEEFLIVSPGCDLDGALAVAERLRCLLSENPLVTAEGVFPITVSLGVTSSEADSGWDSESAVRAADRALYRAKELGRNRVETCRAGDVDS